MKRLINWLKKSNRRRHPAGGYAIGVGADDAYCAAYSGVLIECL